MQTQSLATKKRGLEGRRNEENESRGSWEVGIGGTPTSRPPHTTAGCGENMKWEILYVSKARAYCGSMRDSRFDFGVVRFARIAFGIVRVKRRYAEPNGNQHPDEDKTPVG